jgi:hypothetical protein
MKSLVMALLGLGSSWGCGGQITTNADGGGDASGDAAACHALALLGGTVTMNNVPSKFAGAMDEAPPMSGTYVLEAATRYTGPGGATGVVETLSATVQITNGAWQVAISENGSATQQRSYQLDRAGTGPHRLAGVCGTTDVNSVSFVPISSLGFVLAVHNKDASEIVEIFRPVMK